MKNFKQIREEWEAKMLQDWKQAKDAYEAQNWTEEVNKDVCTTKSNSYYPDENDFNDLKRVIEEAEKWHKEVFYYKEIYSADVDIDIYDDREYDICSITPFLLQTGYVPLENVEDILENTQIFRNHMQELVYKRSLELGNANTWRKMIDCKIGELFKTDIISFDQFVQATYSNCQL